MAEKAEKMEKLFSSSDLKMLSLELHSVKSTARAVGALRLSELAGVLEGAAGNGESETLSRTLPDFLMQYRSLGESIQAALAPD